MSNGGELLHYLYHLLTIILILNFILVNNIVYHLMILKVESIFCYNCKLVFIMLMSCYICDCPFVMLTNSHFKLVVKIFCRSN